MNELDVLINQTINAYEWTTKLLEAVPFEKWELTPGVVEFLVAFNTTRTILLL